LHRNRETSGAVRGGRQDRRRPRAAGNAGKGGSAGGRRLTAPGSLAGPRARFLLLLAAALIPIAFYWPTTRFGFLLDDTVLFQKSASLDDLGSIPRGFLTDVGALRKGTGTVISSYYRPIFLTLSTLYHQAAGGAPAAWHAAAVVVAGLIGALACGFLLRLAVPPLLALLGSIVYSLHPAHVSSVAWASGLQELLAAFFVLVALHAALWRLGEQRDTPSLAAAAAAFACGLLSKEVAIGLLPFLALWALGAAASDRPLARRLWRVTGVLAAVTALYLAVRVAVLGGLAQPVDNAPRLAAALAAAPVAFSTYLRLLVWPAGFSFFRPERPNFAPFGAPVLLSLAVVAALAMLGAWAWRRKSPLWLPAAWFAAWLLPVLNLWALPPSFMVTDRYLFLPSLALPWALALLLPRRAAVAVLSGLALVFAFLGWRYCAIFANERVFLAAMENAEPTSPMVFEEKGRLLLKDGDVAAARTALLRAVQLDPIAPGALASLGDIERQHGDLAAAEQHYRQALVVRPEESRSFKLLALDLARSGQRAKASALVEEAVRRWPRDFEVELLAALLRGANGNRRQAAEAFEAARHLRPHDPAVEGGLDSALERILPKVLPP
jgi:tetratricopeptide (TPR) repeat protein